MRIRVFKVLAEFDDEAGVWYVAESNIPGLSTSAKTSKQLMRRVTMLLPDLVELNAHILDGRSTRRREVPLEFTTRVREQVAIPAFG